MKIITQKIYTEMWDSPNFENNARALILYTMPIELMQNGVVVAEMKI